MTPLWKATLRVPAAGAETLAAALENAEPAAASLLAFTDADEKTWSIEALYAAPPDAAALGALAAAEGGRLLHVAQLPDVDWVKRSLESLPPIRAGRFFVSGAHDRHKAPGGSIRLQIEAAQAFGTGSHPTTRGCLLAIDALTKARRFTRPVDVGTGSGILAFALSHVLAVPVLGTDIDPVAVATARDNARVNAVHPRVRFVAADGLHHPTIASRAPFDLILANILAGPLKRLARPLSQVLAPAGIIVLSGLLAQQERYVLSAYQAQGLRLVSRRIIDGWATLTLRG